jgi:nitric oxide dioxygenase
MTPERKRLVMETWQSVAADHDRIASAFYERLFEIDPHAHQLFANTNMVDQRAKVVAMLTDIIRDLDHLEALIPVVIALGRRHKDYGVVDTEYDLVREALLGAIGDALGGFTPDVRDAWEEAYALTAAVMKRAGERAAAAATP